MVGNQGDSSESMLFLGNPGGFRGIWVISGEYGRIQVNNLDKPGQIKLLFGINFIYLLVDKLIKMN